MNKVIIIGNLTRDPEVSMTMNGKACSKFTIAVNEYYKGSEAKTTFIDCCAFDKVADSINRVCFKGKKVAIEGKINVYDGQTKTGSSYRGFNIIVNNIEYLSPKEDLPTYSEAMANYDNIVKEEAESTKENSDEEFETVEKTVKGWGIDDHDLPF